MDKNTALEIFEDCGLEVNRYEPVHGGDINEAFCVHTADSRYFLKVNDALSYPAMFEMEADGLAALHLHSGLIVPAVINNGHVGSKQYLLLEWLERASLQPHSWEQFGRALATMHKQQQASHGWHVDNYIGSLAQRNTPQNDWATFFSECRVLPLVKTLFENDRFNMHDMRNAERLCARETLFPNEHASLLHGDLWSGNFMITQNGMAAMYDPAVYCGHREMDIGMTMLFGGFDLRFYQAYNEVYPLAAGWRERLPLVQLYPILVHAALFGGHYVNKARMIIQQYAQ